jgi:hypothetical protein
VRIVVGFRAYVRHADALQGIVTTVTVKTYSQSQVWVSNCITEFYDLNYDQL